MQKKYVNKVIKRLRCSGKKRKEIKKQLTSEVEAALVSGEGIDTVVTKMGRPEEIAEEFNRSFSQEEEKRYRREKRNRFLLILAAVLLLLILAAYWAMPKSRSLAESRGFQEEAVKEKAEEIISLVEADDYAVIQEEAISSLAGYFSREAFLEGKEIIGPDWGKREALGTMYTVEVTQLGMKLALVQVKVAYEHVSVTYTISFNQKMELAGLYIQ
ncbi:MAG: DUF3887 domain-containing protein [Lachnospiraceae bacterium]|nr:DUF3887 domain-containing protein [Lachnospiraceae bacterium]